MMESEIGRSWWPRVAAKGARRWFLGCCCRLLEVKKEKKKNEREKGGGVYI